jgi:hypothetical protein
MDRLAKKNASPEATEDLIPGVLSNISLPPKRREHYVQRLRHGLYYYYARRYRPIESYEQD